MLSSIRRAMCGLRLDYFGRVFVSMLKAFADDSGSGGDSPWFVLAGYIGSVENWVFFDSLWRPILDGPPKLKYFKSSEAESLRPDGQWVGISKEDRNSRIDSLIAVIGRCVRKAIYIRVKQQDYDDIIKSYVPPQWDNPYFFLFMSFILSVKTIEKYWGRGEPIEVVFDSSDPKRIENPSKRLYHQVADLCDLTDRIVTVSYEDEKICLPLQAADLLAWQVRRKFCVKEPTRKQFYAALACPQQGSYNYTLKRDDLKRYGTIMDEDAKRKWAGLGLPEENRPWKRP